MLIGESGLIPAPLSSFLEFVGEFKQKKKGLPRRSRSVSKCRDVTAGDKGLVNL